MHPDLAKLVSASKLSPAAAENLSSLEPGTFCLHASWGPGRIASWDLGGDRLVVDFEARPGHEMKLEFAAKSIEPLSPGHVLARRVADPAGLAAMAEQSPTDLVALILESYGGSIMLDRFEEIVRPRIVPEGRFKSWWENTKRALRGTKSFVVPSKRTSPLESRAAGLSHADALVGDFKSAKDLKPKVKAAEAIVANLAAFPDSTDRLREVLSGLEESGTKSLRLQPALAFELLLIRDELIEKFPALAEAADASIAVANCLAQERKSLSEVLRNLPVGRQKQLLKAFIPAFGEAWLSEALARLNDTTGRTVSEIARFILDQGQVEELTIFLQTGLQNRSLSGDLLQWISRERKGDAFEVFDSDFAAALLTALEREHYEESNRRSGRLQDLVINDRELLADLAVELDPSQVKTFARRLWASPVFDELSRRSLLARLIKVAPEVQHIIEHSDDDADGSDEVLVVSASSYLERQIAFENLIKVQIPQNTKDIQVARSYGDLRENFEFKSAKEQQRVLMRRQSTMERELQKARPTEFKDAPTHVVTIGTVVDITDVESGQTESYSILGAWDTDPQRKIVSYLSGMGKALLGKAVGEQGQVPTETGEMRMVTISGIRRYAE